MIAQQRLQGLKKKFKRDLNYQSEYAEFLGEVIQKGFAEIVPPAHVNRTDGKVWYLPHHGVYHPKKKTIRVVFDCGASFQGTQLRTTPRPQSDKHTNRSVGTLSTGTSSNDGRHTGHVPSNQGNGK